MPDPQGWRDGFHPRPNQGLYTTEQDPVTGEELWWVSPLHSFFSALYSFLIFDLVMLCPLWLFCFWFLCWSCSFFFICYDFLFWFPDDRTCPDASWGLMKLSGTVPFLGFPLKQLYIYIYKSLWHEICVSLPTTEWICIEKDEKGLVRNPWSPPPIRASHNPWVTYAFFFAVNRKWNCLP